MDIDELFKIAANHARSVKNVSEKDMLKLYGLYKQAKDGPCNIPKPYMWDFTAKAKWENWKAVIHLSNTQAKQQYIDLIRNLDPSWDENTLNESEDTSPRGLGVSVSILLKDPEDIMNDCDKTVFDWCKEENLDKLKIDIEKDKKLIHIRDEDNLTLLHWAVDHGYLELTNYLLQVGCNINSQDSDLQTPLHYAVTCGHTDIVKLLLDAGVNQQLQDNDGNEASVYCESDSMTILFANST